ncbi:MAG: IS3 family transposase [Paralcaligenes sp.]
MPAYWVGAGQLVCPRAYHRAIYREFVVNAKIDEQYTKYSFYGRRKMVAVLRRDGHPVNRKRIQRLMRLMGPQSVASGPNTRRPHPQHKGYPYLLRGLILERPH